VVFKTYTNTLVWNHFHSVKSFLFLSARPHNFDGMLGTELPLSMYTTKNPINMWHFNIPQLKEFLAFSVKDRYQLNYFICIIHVIKLLCYNWRFFINVFDACFYCLLMFSFCLLQYWTNCIPFQYILFILLVVFHMMNEG